MFVGNVAVGLVVVALLELRRRAGCCCSRRRSGCSSRPTGTGCGPTRSGGPGRRSPRPPRRSTSSTSAASRPPRRHAARWPCSAPSWSRSTCRAATAGGGATGATAGGQLGDREADAAAAGPSRRARARSGRWPWAPSGRRAAGPAARVGPAQRPGAGRAVARSATRSPPRCTTPRRTGELRLVTARSSYEAVHDPLTGLVNRAALLASGDQTLRAARPRPPGGAAAARHQPVQRGQRHPRARGRRRAAAG